MITTIKEQMAINDSILYLSFFVNKLKMTLCQEEFYDI